MAESLRFSSTLCSSHPGKIMALPGADETGTSQGPSWVSGKQSLVGLGSLRTNFAAVLQSERYRIPLRRFGAWWWRIWNPPGSMMFSQLPNLLLPPAILSFWHTAARIF